MTTERTADIHIQADPKIMANTEPILAAIGLSFSDAFNLMLHQIFLKQRIPFELSSVQLTENGYTEEAEEELFAVAEEAYLAVENGAETYRNIKDLRTALDAEDDYE